MSYCTVNVDSSSDLLVLKEFDGKCSNFCKIEIRDVQQRLSTRVLDRCQNCQKYQCLIEILICTLVNVSF